MSTRVEFQRVLNRLEAQKADDRIPHVLNEAGQVYKRKWFKTAYDNWMSSSGYPGASISPKTGEQLRADLGVDPEDNVKEMLISAGLPEDSFKIEIHQRGDEKALSGKFPTVVIIILKNITIGTEHFLQGEEYSVVSNINKTADGEKAPISGGKLTPKALNLENGVYSSADELVGATLTNLESIYGQTFPKNYMEYLKDLVINTQKQTSIKPVSGNLTKFLKEGAQKFVLDFGKNLQEEYGIDSVSLAKIANDFGEILGGIFFFSVVTNPGKGVSFPKGANAALVDFHFDGWDISSKAGKKGGTPSIVAMCNIINDRVKGKVKGKDFELNGYEKKTYDDIIKVIADPKLNGGYDKEPDNSGRQSMVWLTNIVLANSLLYNDKKTGYRYILDTLGINNMQISRNQLHDKVDEIFNKNTKEWYKIMDEFWKRTGSRPSGCKNEKSATTYYTKRMKKKDPMRFGVIFYPVSMELVKTINSNKMYVDGLSSMVNRVSSVQQLYLLVSGKSTGLEFKLKDFAEARFQFSAGTGANEPFNKNIGLESR
jgi:hypothetical protein